MAKKTVTTNQLTPNDTVMIRGKVAFSRIASLIDGEELQRSIERAQKRGQKFFKERPYYTLSIYDAGVIFDDPANKTLFETYAQESLYTSTNPEKPGWHFQIEGTGILPEVAQFNPETGEAHQILLEGELDNELDVTLILRVFATKMNNGVALSGVIVNEPIRYYNQSRLSRALEEKGISYKPLPANQVREHQAKQADAEDVYQPEEDAVAEPVEAPVGNPYGYQPQTPPQQANNPYGSKAANKGGIRWNPNDPNNN